jgi:hypothetical protein
VQTTTPHAPVTYDLQGRMVNDHQARGIVVSDHRKVIK